MYKFEQKLQYDNNNSNNNKKLSYRLETGRHQCISL